MTVVSRVPARRAAEPRRGGSSVVRRPRGDQLSVVNRLRDPMPHDRLTGWVVTLGITALAFVLRLINLGYPRDIVFDETYYAKDAWTLLHLGYEGTWPDGDDINARVEAGETMIFGSGADYVVHPPLGKWLIAAGEWAFGMNSFGWRFGALIFGTLLVFMVIRLARRVSRSTLIGAVAGLLLCFDGLAFVMSRIALLDIFQAFFLTATVAAMVADRDWFRERLGRWLTRRGLADLDGRFGPIMLWRPWRLVVGVMAGCAIAVKWNSAFLLAVMCVVTLLWDVSARRMAGGRWSALWGLLADGIPAFVWQVVVAFGTYVASWTGWFATSGGWKRGWGTEHPDDPLTRWFGADIASWLSYHEEMAHFHTVQMVGSTHHYEAHPAGWLFMVRPIGIDAVNGIEPGTNGCPVGGDECIRVISGMGTPLLWWMAAAALVAGLYFWWVRRDWRFSVPILAMAAIYLPWFMYTERALFFFYAICIIPFTVVNLSLVLGRILGPAHSGPRRQRGAIIAGAAVALVVANFAFIYPVLTDGLLPRWQWALRMWFNSWI